MKNHLLSKVIFLCLIVSASLPSYAGLIDYNLSLRFLLTSFFALAFIIDDRKLPSGIWMILLLLVYGWSALTISWSLSPPDAVFVTQRTLLYAMVFGIGIRAIQIFGKSFFLGTITSLAILIVIFNTVELAMVGLNLDRFVGTSAHPNLLGSFAFLMLPLLLASLHHQNLKRWAIGALIAMVALIIILKTRSVWFAMVTFFALLIPWFLKWKRTMTMIFIGLSTLAVIAAAFAVYQMGLIDLTSLQERVFMWEKTTRLIEDHWLLGVGTGNWELNWPRYGLAGFDTIEVYGVRMQRPHNDYLWVLSELGVIGFGLLVAFAVRVFRTWYRSEQRTSHYPILAGIIAFGVISFFSFPSERIEHIVLLFLTLAFLMVDQVPESSKRFSWTSAVLIPLGIFSLVVGSYRLMGEWHGKAMLNAINEERYEDALAEAEQAESAFFRIIPGGTSIASFKADAMRNLEITDERFESETQRAARLTPNSYEALSNFGMVLNKRAQYEQAVIILNRAHEINPRYDGAILNLAIVHYNAGNYAASKEWIDKVHYKSEITDYYSGLIHKKLGIE